MLRALIIIFIVCFAGNPASASENFRKLSGWGELAELAQGKIVLFSDRHSKKGPANTMVSYLERLEKTDNSVLIGIELHSPEQSRLDVFMASDGSDDDIASLLTNSVFWEAPGAHDGRANAAWLEVIKTARDMRASGKSITLIAIVDTEAGVSWDGPSAKAFMEKMKAGKFDTAVVLAGGAHTDQNRLFRKEEHPSFAKALGSENVVSLNANNADTMFEFRILDCPDADGEFTGVYLRPDVFAINDTHKYDGVFCANMRRSPYASPKTEAAFKKRMARD